MLNQLKRELNYTHTENGAGAYKSTLSPLVDFFASSGALRGNPTEFKTRFDRALVSSPVDAMVLLFHARDVRGGQGERENFRETLRYLALHEPVFTEQVLKLVPSYGRWDDLFVLENTPLESRMISLVGEQFGRDIHAMRKGESISLLAKWLPSEPWQGRGRSSFLSKFLAHTGIEPRDYRKILTQLRKHIGIVESKMSTNQWDLIDYSTVPSQALNRYIPTFFKHDEERFKDWMSSKTNIKTSTLTPVEIIRQARKKYWDSELDKTYTALWEALPDHSSNDNTLVMVDVSGSMTVGSGSIAPIDVALSLGLYFGERNKGIFHNHFLTFSAEPQLVQIQGRTLSEKLLNMEDADWAQNTNLEMAFDLLLYTILEHEVPPSERPSRLLVVSDMEFDEAMGCQNIRNHFSYEPLFKSIRAKWDAVEIPMPELVFWNVNAGSQFPVQADERGVLLVSGYNPNIFSLIAESKDLSPETFVQQVLQSPRYTPVYEAYEQAP